MMLRRTTRILGFSSFLAASSGMLAAHAQAQPAPSAAPAPAPAEPTQPGTPAPAPAPTDGAAPAPSVAPTSATPPPSYAPPPGYKLVPIQEQPAETRYDVQYPQRRGALPPGMELPYTDGQTIPPGYRLVERNRRGLIIAGSVVTGVFWLFSVTGAVAADYEDKSGFLLLPALGPWLMLAAGGGKDEPCAQDEISAISSCGDRSALRAILVLDGIVQTAGAAMFVSGFAFPNRRLVRDDVTVGVVPVTLGRDGHGLGVVGTF